MGREEGEDRVLIIHFTYMRKELLLIAFCLAFFCTLSHAQGADSVYNAYSPKVAESNSAYNDVGTPLPVAVKTDDSGDFMKDDFNLYGIVALIVAFCSLIVSFVTWIAQSKTEKHTRKVPFWDQQEKFKELSSIAYNNTTNTVAAAILFFNSINKDSKGDFYAYPSERLLKNLIIMPEDIILSIDAHDMARVSVIRSVLRRGNVDVDSTLAHITKKGIKESIIKEDIRGLIFRFFIIVNRVYELEWRMISRSPKKYGKNNGITSYHDLYYRSTQMFCEAFVRDIYYSLQHYCEKCNYIELISSESNYVSEILDYVSHSVSFLLKDDSIVINSNSFLKSEENFLYRRNVLSYLSELHERYPNASPILDAIKSIINSTGEPAVQILRKMILVSAVLKTDGISMIPY